MNPKPTNYLHWLFLAALLVSVTAIVLLWSVRGLGYPNPNDNRRPLSQITADSYNARQAAITRFTLLCLDSLGKARSNEAIKYCDRAIKLDARSVEALNLRGNAHWLAGHTRLAIADFSRAITLAPRNPQAFRFRANVHAALHQDALALSDYNRAMQLAPSDPINVELRGHFYQQRGRYTQAIADFSAAITLRPSIARAWNSLCWTRLLANTRLSQALSDCDRALSLDPTSTNALDSRGFVLLRMHRFSAAISSFSTALSLNPKLASSWFGRGVAKLRVNDKSAARDIAKAKRLEPGIEARFLNYGMKFRTAAPPET